MRLGQEMSHLNTWHTHRSVLSRRADYCDVNDVELLLQTNYSSCYVGGERHARW